LNPPEQRAAQRTLLTRLSAIHEAATVDVLCADKTGTLTRNELLVTAVIPMRNDLREDDVLAWAALASSDSGQDPVDSAIRASVLRRGSSILQCKVLRFTPFDPATKTSEALITDERGHEQRVVKGAPVAIASIAPIGPEVTAELEQLTGQGYRVLAVAGGPPQQLMLMGLIALSDPPRPDSKGLLTELRSMGVHSVMVTGDAAPTAAAVASAIGLEGPVCPPGAIPDRVRPEDYSV
jgi:H+-transporting ATPase